MPNGAMREQTHARGNQRSRTNNSNDSVDCQVVVHRNSGLPSGKIHYGKVQTYLCLSQQQRSLSGPPCPARCRRRRPRRHSRPRRRCARTWSACPASSAPSEGPCSAVGPQLPLVLAVQRDLVRWATGQLFGDVLRRLAFLLQEPQFEKQRIARSLVEPESNRTGLPLELSHFIGPAACPWSRTGTQTWPRGGTQESCSCRWPWPWPAL